MKKLAIGISTLFIFNISYGVERISLQEAVERALYNNYELKASKKQLEAKKYEYLATKGMKYPTLKFGEIFMRTNVPGWAMMNLLNQERLTIQNSAWFVDMTAFNSPMFTFPSPSYPEVNNFQTKFEVNLPLYTGGKIETGIEMRKKDYEATKKDVKRTEQKVIYDVSRAYYGALLAKRAISLAKQAIKSAKKHYRTAKLMYETGLTIKADVLRARVYLEEARAKLKEAQSQYLTAKKGLLLAMGVDDVKPEDIEIVGELDFEDTPRGIDYWQSVALENRPDLKAIQERVEIAKKMEEFTKADLKPTVGAFASYEWDDKDFPVLGDGGSWWTAGVALNWKLFDGYQTLNKQKAAREMYKKYRHQEKGFEEYIKFKVYEAYQKLQSAKAKVRTAQKNRRWAREVLKVTETRYKNQLATMIDLIDTQTLYDKTGFDLARAIYEAKMSLLNLKYEAGVLNLDTIDKYLDGDYKKGGDK